VRVAGVARRERRLFEFDDVRLRERVVGQPLVDSQPAHTDCGQRVTTVVEFRRAHDARQRADAEARVAATDLAAALDEHHAELVVVAQTLADHHAVTRFEHVQRQQAVREQHRAEREHRKTARPGHRVS
jgi:hypothetical protein